MTLGQNASPYLEAVQLGWWCATLGQHNRRSVGSTVQGWPTLCVRHRAVSRCSCDSRAVPVFDPKKTFCALVAQLPPAVQAAARLGAPVTWLLYESHDGSVDLTVVVGGEGPIAFGNWKAGPEQFLRLGQLFEACHCTEGWGWHDLRAKRAAAAQ